MFTMKQIQIFVLCVILFSLDGFAQQQYLEKHKYSMGVIPVLSYDADLGLKYGAVLNFFDFKPHDTDYSQYLVLRGTYTTRNTLNIQGIFESDRLIKNATTIIEAAYTNDQKLGFYGFNGFESNYNPLLIQAGNQQFIDKNFYTINRNLLRFRFDVQKNIFSQWRVLSGLTFSRYFLGSNNEGQPTLYDYYQQWGIVPENEASGGSLFNATLGLVFDSRDNKTNCKSGQWFEGFLVYAPALLKQTGFSKLVLTYRNYFSFFNDDLTLLFRVSSQTKLSGDIPHYMLPLYFDTQESQNDFGGAYTLRGIARNRIVSNGYLLGNFESRFNIAHFKLLLDFQISGILFCDLAYITQPYAYSMSKISESEQNIFFNNQKQTLYAGFGPGINIIYNQNNIITVNYGFNANPQLGNGGFYVGSRFLF